MKSLGISEAKARLSELIKLAENGAEVTITRRAKPVAKLVPATAKCDAAARAAIFDELNAFAKSVRARPFNLRKLVEWGRT